MNEIITGDCLTTLKTLSHESVDLLVTDPPYGYSFMGKDWDKAVPSVEVWQECLRVLKPGSFAFVMSAPRQDVLSQMIVRLGVAGFDTSFTSIYWTYASGFPKAANVGKLVDKRLGAERERLPNPQPLGAWRKAEERTDVPTDMPSNDPITPQAKALDGSYAGFQPKPAVEVIIVAMKPLSEKTYVDQALANGKGITWLDDARIPYQNKDDLEGAKVGHKEQMRAWNKLKVAQGARKESILNKLDEPIPPPNPQGRFPANLLVSDDVLNDGRITKSNGHTPSNRGDFLGANGIYGKATDKQEHTDYKFNDSGSYSRYFDLDKWAEKTLPFLIVPKASKSEKDKGLEDMPDSKGLGQWNIEDNGNATAGLGNHNPSCLTCGKSRYNRGNGICSCQEPNWKAPQNKPVKNNHPTVKPLKLMSYLITMGSRPNDVILDPFSGSGTTCLAAKQLGRRYLGLELSEEYATIARKRLESISSLLAFSDL